MSCNIKRTIDQYYSHMNYKKSFLGLTCLTLVTCGLFAQTETQQKRLDSIMQLAHARGIFNGNVLIAQNGKVIYERSLGYVDGSKTKPLTSAYKFDIGSVSKEFNGAAILLLKQRGLLSLDDPISKFLPGLPEWSG